MTAKKVASTLTDLSSTTPPPQLFPCFLVQKPLRYRRAISYDSKEYYMRLLSGNPGMYQHSVEHTTEGETAQHEPEHGEDTIAKVKGTRATHPCTSLIKIQLLTFFGVVVQC